jgi:hypothetical protein
MRGSAAIVAILALVCAGNASANMFSASESMSDFRFRNGRVVYTDPDLRDAKLEFADNGVILSSTEAGIEGGNRPGEVIGRLNLGGKGARNGNFPGQYTSFGSRQSASESSTTRLIEDTLDTVQPDGAEQSLGFLTMNTLTTGDLGTKLLSEGMYATVAGLTEQEAMMQRKLGKAAFPVNAPDDPDGVSSSASAVPIPATPLLLLAALVGLRFSRPRA